MRASKTAEMIFDNCRIHQSQILGEVGEGFVQSLKIFMVILLQPYLLELQKEPMKLQLNIRKKDNNRTTHL